LGEDSDEAVVLSVAGLSGRKSTDGRSIVRRANGLNRKMWKGEARNLRTLFIDRWYEVIDYNLVGSGAIALVKGMLREAKQNGGRYSRKLIWLWREGKEAGWDEDEIAYWILSGDWHELKMGQDLREVF